MNWRDVTDVIQLTLSDSEGPNWTTAQSHSTTTVLFRTTFTRTILLNLLMKCGIIQEKNIPRYTLLFIIARASKLSNWGNRGEKSRRRAARERRSECIL